MRAGPALVAIALFASLGGAAEGDQLQCFKIRDPFKLKGVIDVTASRLVVQPGCKLGKAVLYCVPASVTIASASVNGDPAMILPVTGAPQVDERLCYRVTCKKPFPADQEATDQFGTRTVRGLKPSLVCGPAVPGPLTTSTSTSTIPASTTTSSTSSTVSTSITTSTSTTTTTSSSSTTTTSTSTTSSSTTTSSTSTTSTSTSTTSTSLVPIGLPCSTGGSCASGVCVDGVCCASACTGSCERCNQAGQLGTCAAVPAGQDPDNECSTSAASTCGTSGTCSGQRSCSLYSAGTICVAAACANGTTSNPADTCDGSGTCLNSGNVSCGVYACNASTGLCRATCAIDADCAPNFVCNAGQCDFPP